EFGKSLLDPINLEIVIQRFPAAAGLGATLELKMIKATGGPNILEDLGWTAADISIQISDTDFDSGGEIYIAESLGVGNLNKIPTISIDTSGTKSFTISAKVISEADLDGNPNTDEIDLTRNNASQGIVIRIGADDPGGIDFIAAPDIHPIFIVLILLGIIFIVRRK
ncbi:hypothetical protein IIC68_02000, partial [archaeon]|nr:hypothetical protein [archaeon]